MLYNLNNRESIRNGSNSKSHNTISNARDVETGNPNAIDLSQIRKILLLECMDVVVILKYSVQG
jgi:hypothetical protein